MLHVARVGLIHTSPTGTTVNKNSAIIQEVLDATQEPRIIEDSEISNSSNNPTIKDYLELEEDSGFTLVHMDQYIIVTKGGGEAVNPALPDFSIDPSGDEELADEDQVEINVSDAEVIRFWVTFESDAADAAEQLIMHIVTSPDGVTYEEGEEWELPFSINQIGVNTPLHIPYEITRSIDSIKIIQFTNTSAAATLSNISVKYKIG